MERPKTAQAALDALIAGNARFAAGESIRPNQDAHTIAKLQETQEPFAVVFGCSDSRVSAELLFDQGFGDLFIVRSAGHVNGRVTQASIEYAIEVLKVKVLVIMGHKNCGAIAAGVDLARGGNDLPGEMNVLPERIIPHFNRFDPENPTENDTLHAVEDHVRGTMSDLVRDSKIVRDGLLNGEISVVGGVFHLDTGRVELMRATGAA